MTGFVEVAVLASTILFVLTWTFVVLVAPHLRWRATISPMRRISIARAWLYAPFWVPLALLAGSLSLGLVADPLGDHCLKHAHWHHLCWVHPPQPTNHAIVWLLPTAILIPALGSLARVLRDVSREGRLAKDLVWVSSPCGLGPDIRLIDQEKPIALTIGWRTPHILLSSGLVQHISSHAFQTVLAHERAHISRGDIPLALIDRFTASLLPRSVANPLLEHISLGREMACDVAAANKVGGPIVVARALTEVAALGMKPVATGLSLVGSTLELRVTYLLQPATKEWGWCVPATILAAVVAAGAGPVHTVVETLITFLLQS
ncbi:M56 family metallopeptidase [Sulfidibacter corallicola]|uniref:M56 family metallopeptidase n=1 Tax=Sulfidibacter corallicola TaxID=2818388 RepID=A0A8A4TNR2_SULCO|nr:M56 family metallopeptidase [Sulfidibacter corallicola]QTD51190.1 M56 family metallopeptidase [Sulfidibacter corallicola]